MSEQMRAFPSDDCLGKFSVTHVLPQALNRGIVLRNHKHSATGPAQPHPSLLGACGTAASSEPPRERCGEGNSGFS